MVLVKNLNFFHLFILGLIGQENVFVNIRTFGIFPKGLVHGFLACVASVSNRVIVRKLEWEQ